MLPHPRTLLQGNYACPHSDARSQAPKALASSGMIGDMRPKFAPEDERGLCERIDQAIKDAYQAAMKSTDDEMLERVWQCLADDNLPKLTGHYQSVRPEFVVLPDPTLQPLYVWATNEYIRRRITELRNRQEISA